MSKLVFWKLAKAWSFITCHTLLCIQHLCVIYHT